MKDIVIIDPNKRQLKGSLHMHTTRSDGRFPPAEAVQRYHDAGYDFAVITDHEVYWNSTELDKPDFLVLGGIESAIGRNERHRWVIQYDFEHPENPWVQFTHMHFGCIKDESLPDEGQFLPDACPVPLTTDRGYDSWNQQIRFLREHGNLVFINHPSWSHLVPEMMLACQDVLGFEVWNSGSVMGCGHRPDEDIWDYCLTRGKRLWAVAGDDLHGYNSSEFDGGFTMVSCDAFTKADICKAFKRGDFYASCGPIIKEMRIENGTLYMRFTPVRQVKITGFDVDTPCFNAPEGQLLEHIEWRVNEHVRLFRPTLIDDHGRCAWGQPVFVEDLL